MVYPETNKEEMLRKKRLKKRQYEPAISSQPVSPESLCSTKACAVGVT